MAEAEKHLRLVADDPGGALRPAVAATDVSPGPGGPPRSGKPAVKQWRVDLKWVFGIPFSLILFSTLVVFSLFQVSGRDNATGALAAMNREVLAEPGRLEELNQGAPQLVTLLQDPQFSAKIYEDPAVLDEALQNAQANANRAELENIPADAPPEAAQAYLEENPVQPNGAQANGGMGALGLPIKMVAGPFHSTMGIVLTVQVVLLLLTGIPYLVLSRRLGRLVSPAVSLALASWLPLLILASVSGAASSWIDGKRMAVGSGEQEQLDRLMAGLAGPWLDNFFGGALSVYRFCAYAAALLLLLAGVAKIILRIRERKPASAAL